MRKSKLDNLMSLKDKGLAYRAATIPTFDTLNQEERSVEAILTTDKPTQVWDWQRWEVVDEVLLMEGAQLPETKQVVMLDSHWRMLTSDVIGSVRNIQVNDNDMVGRLYFASDADSQWQKVQEKHLTDVSIGYKVQDFEWIEAGKTKVVNGRKFKGPVKVVTEWRLLEVSLVPIGADQFAKLRALAPVPEPEKNKDTEVTETMDEKLRGFLESRGLPKQASEDEAWRFLSQLDVPKSDSDTDLEAEKQKAIEAERQRTLEIKAMCAKANKDELADTLIESGASIEEARKQVLDAVLKEKQPKKEEAVLGGARLVIDERDKFMRAAEDAILMREGLAIEGDKPAPGAEDLMGFTLLEMARHSLKLANQKYLAADNMELVGRAFTSSDFPVLLKNVANKALFDGFNTAEETWQQWCGTGSLNDFKPSTIAKISVLDGLEKLNEHGEYKYGKLPTDAEEEAQLETAGKIWAITRQTIINDDTGAIVDRMRGRGEVAARYIGDMVYNVLIANPTLKDGHPLFSSNHGNLTTPGSEPDKDSISKLETQMGLQKDISGTKALNIRPQYFIAPLSLKGTTETFFTSEYLDRPSGSSRIRNIYAGNYFTRIYDARLDDDSISAWYLAGRKGTTIKVFFLRGRRSPRLEVFKPWNVDGVEYKVTLDAVAAPVDYRALAKNVGQ